MSVSKVSFGGNDLINLESDTVTAADMLSGKTAHDSSGAIITGAIQSVAASTITPGTTDQTIAAGKYLSGAQTISGDANLVAGNIRDGISIFGVTGTAGGGGVFGSITGSGTSSMTVNTGLAGADWFYMAAGIVTSLSIGKIESVIKVPFKRGVYSYKYDSSGTLKYGEGLGTVIISDSGVVTIDLSSVSMSFDTISYTWYATIQ